MGCSWRFKQATPGDRARESQVEKFFSSDAVRDRANALLREGIQNSLDAAPHDQTVLVRITIGHWNSDVARERLPLYESGFSEHAAAEGVSSQLHLPTQTDPFRYLVFEDFGTSGLLGDPSDWWPDEHGKAEPFFKYFRAEGMSGKGDGARGRHGVGRLVFMFASRIRAMYGLTRRNGSAGAEELLMGTTVLRNHRLEGTPYLPDGWFGVPDAVEPALTLPVRDASFIAMFKQHFGVSRASETGLSVVVPWLAEDVTFESVARAVLSEYYFPILSGKLRVEVRSDEDSMHLTRENLEHEIEKRLADSGAGLMALVKLATAGLGASEWLNTELPDGGAPRWTRSGASGDSSIISGELGDRVHNQLEAGDPVFIRVPVAVRQKGDAVAQPSEFRIMLERTKEAAEGVVQFLREGILISDVRPRRTTSVRGIVLIERGALGEFLGDAENPSHTQWQRDMVKDKYVYAPGLLDFVVQSIPSLLAEISRREARPDATILLGLFSLPARQGPKRRTTVKTPEAGPESLPPRPEIPSKPRRYSILRLDTGFALRPGDIGAERPRYLQVKVAYDVRRGNAFTKYSRADFELAKDGVEMVVEGCVVVSHGSNIAFVRVDSDDFRFAVTGFDVSNRDLQIDVRVRDDIAQQVA